MRPLITLGKRCGALTCSLLLALQSSAFAENSDAFEFFQEEAKVTIATLRAQSPEEAPAIVSVVTREEIERYGHRDLADILRTVPGFEFGVDVHSLAGLESRGIWAHEGKALLMLNGITLNEFGFGNYNFFGTLPASIIERVEVIRGPGSALYGGFAEVAVINVITLTPATLNGLRTSGEVGVMEGGGVSRHGNISFGHETPSLRLAAHIGYGSQTLSHRDYTDFFGGRLPQNDNTAYRHWRHVLTEASSHDFTVRYQRTSLRFMGQDLFSAIAPPVNGVDLQRESNYMEATHLDYVAHLSSRLTLQPLFEYYNGNTIATDEIPAAADGLYAGPGARLSRYRGELVATYQTRWEAELKLGAGHIRDLAENIGSDGTPGLQVSADPNDVTTHQQTSSTFGYTQYLQRFGPIGLTVGARYEDTSFGSAFAPRTGLTYHHERFNGKLLYGKAFRIPLPWQAYSRDLGFAGDLKPETANTGEMELGYKFSSHWTGKMNAFYIDIDRPLVYTGSTNSYVNFGKIQSEGLEGELRVRYASAGGFANISYARPGSETSPGFTTVSKKQFLSTPPVKINLGTYYRSGIVEWAPSLTYLAHRAGQSSESANDPSGTLGTVDYPALVLANMNISARNLLKDFDLQLAVHNLFDTRYTLIQPYYGGHAPLPAQDREITLGVTWHL